MFSLLRKYVPYISTVYVVGQNRWETWLDSWHTLQNALWTLLWQWPPRPPRKCFLQCDSTAMWLKTGQNKPKSNLKLQPRKPHICQIWSLFPVFFQILLSSCRRARFERNQWICPSSNVQYPSFNVQPPMSNGQLSILHPSSPTASWHN